MSDAGAPGSATFLHELRDKKLAVVIYETWWHRKFLKQAKTAIFHPRIPSLPDDVDPAKASPSPAKSKGIQRSEKLRAKKAKAKEQEMEQEVEVEDVDELATCRLCHSLEEDEKCIRLYEVRECADAESLYGVAMTCVPEADRLQALPLVRLGISLCLSPDGFGSPRMKMETSVRHLQFDTPIQRPWDSSG